MTRKKFYGDCVCGHASQHHAGDGCLVPYCRCKEYFRRYENTKAQFSMQKYPRGRIRGKDQQYYEAI